MSNFFSSCNFSEIQPFSLSTYIDFLVRLYSPSLFTPDSSWRASWYTNHLCGLLPSFLARIFPEFSSPRNQYQAPHNEMCVLYILDIYISQVLCLHEAEPVLITVASFSWAQGEWHEQKSKMRKFLDNCFLLEFLIVFYIKWNFVLGGKELFM